MWTTSPRNSPSASPVFFGTVAQSIPITAVIVLPLAPNALLGASSEDQRHIVVVPRTVIVA
jgi:hypothetical protein